MFHSLKFIRCECLGSLTLYVSGSLFDAKFGIVISNPFLDKTINQIHPIELLKPEIVISVFVATAININLEGLYAFESTKVMFVIMTTFYKN